jgi:hypothetical protein
MIRINDHLFRVDLLRHIWIETDGENYVLFLHLEGAEPFAMLMVNRELAEEALDSVQDAVEKLYDDDCECDFVD